MEWKKPENEMPKDQVRVVCLVKNEQGRIRVVMAEHVSAKTILAEDFLSDEDDNEELKEYDAEKDCLWVKENWFESNLCQETNYVMYYPVLAWAKIEIPIEFKI